MIDYITAKFPCHHDWRAIHQFRHGYRTARLKIGGTTIEVKSLKNGRFLAVSGNPIKAFQGHNIFGCNDLKGLCRDLFALVIEQLKIDVNRFDQHAIDIGQYSLSRVDLAVNFRLPSDEVVATAIREMEFHWREKNLNVSNYGAETVYLNQYSKVSSAKFYNKRREISARPLPESLLGQDKCEKLRSYTEGLLRTEFVLRSPALKKLGLNVASEWTIKIANEITKEKMSSLALTRSVRCNPVPTGYHSWKPELKQIYRLWSQGNMLTAIYETKTLQRRRKSLMEFGIDIRNPPVDHRISLVPLNLLLTPGNMTRVPRFAKRLGLIYKPLRV
jgi:II/X family phage/plasmid replication protein